MLDIFPVLVRKQYRILERSSVPAHPEGAR